MDLSKYNDKKVRIITIDDEIFDGICSYNSEEYSLLEVGRKSENLQILSYLFYPEDIKEVMILDEFKDDYGLLEEEIIKDGFEEITDAIEYTIDDHTYRILCCLESHPELQKKREILEYIEAYSFKDNRIKEKIIELKNNWL